VRNVGTGVMDFSPLAYTGRPEAFSNRTSRGFVFELSLNVKF